MKAWTTCVILSVTGLLTVSDIAADERVDVLEGIKVDFDLVGGDGNRVRDEDLRGKHVLITFGFTHCPHVCPTIAASMGAALELTASDAVGVFVSVDTERDTPPVTAEYAARFGARMIGLSGSYDDVTAAAKNFKVSYVVTKTHEAYTVQHSPTIFLLSPAGEVLNTFSMNATPAELAEAIDGG